MIFNRFISRPDNKDHETCSYETKINAFYYSKNVTMPSETAAERVGF